VSAKAGYGSPTCAKDGTGGAFCFSRHGPSDFELCCKDERDNEMLALDQSRRNVETPPRRTAELPLDVADLAQGRLRGCPYGAVRNVACDYRDGVLVLRGRVPSYYLKQMAQAVVGRAGAVERVVNLIEVVNPVGQTGRPEAP
jgi:hypothetical protein